MKTIGSVLDLDGMRKEIADLGEQVAAPDLWDDQANAQRVTGRLSALQHDLERFTEPARAASTTSSVMVELAAEESDADAAAETEAELKRLLKSVEQLEVRTLLSGEYDAREAIVSDPVRRRWCRRGRLRRDADADVHALGRAQQVPRRGLRHLLRRGGRPEVRDLRDPRALRLRHAERRGRHPPARADQPVRQPGPPPDQLRRGRGGAGARADRRDRHPRGGHPRRRLPLERSRVVSR